MRAVYWVPPTAWMALILLLSSDPDSGEHTGAVLKPLVGWVWPAASPLQLQALHGLVRKLGHFGEYAVLAALWFRALRHGRGWAPGLAAGSALAISVAWAILDESYQAFVPNRLGSGKDVVVDAFGALAAVALIQVGWRRSIRRATTVLFWVAAVGGAALLLIEVLVGVTPVWLWFTVPTAMLMLVGLRRLRP